MKHKNRREQREIASERITRLFEEADKAALAGELELSDEYVGNARKISIRNNLPIPSELKRKYCRHCYKYLLPGKTSQVRVNSREKKVDVSCLLCGKKSCHPYSREIKERRRNR